jgi:Mg/Co/Ni transporter MgtE
VSNTREDYQRDYLLEKFAKLNPEERLEILKSLSLQEQGDAMERLPPRRIEEVLRVLDVLECRKILQQLLVEQCLEVLRSMRVKERLAALSPEQRWEVLQSLPVEEIRQFLEVLTAGRPTQPRKPRRKK